MAEDTIKSGAEIVKEFLDGLETDQLLDRGTVEAIRLLYLGGSLTQTKLQQALEGKRREKEKHG